MIKSFAESIDALYVAFGEVPKPGKIEGCPCCIGAKEICILLSKPLRALGPNDLSSYAESAFLTVGEEADYLYFLPRIVELSCLHHQVWWPDPSMTGRAISKTKPVAWPAERRDALLDVLHARIQSAFEEDDGWAIDDWICAISKMGLDVELFLAQVETSPLLVKSYYERNSQPLMTQRLGNAFWNKEDSGYDKVVEWFNSPRILALIAKAYGMTPDAEV